MAIEVVARQESLAQLSGTVVVPVTPELQVAGWGEALDSALGAWFLRAIRALGLAGRVGQAGVLPPCDGMAAERVILVGVGAATQRTATDLRRAAAFATKLAIEAGGRNLAWPVVPVTDGSAAVAAQAIVEGTILASYRFHRYRGSETSSSLDRLLLVTADPLVASGLQRGRLWGEAVTLARDLTNEPANVLSPERLAGFAWEVASAVGLECTVYDHAALEELGAGAMLAVGAGSRHEPRLIHLTYRPSSPTRGRVALVGKAVTFDSGGLSLKPAEGMERMKGDMAGGAVVLAVMRALPALSLPLEVHGIVAAAENMPDGGAFRPGDILRTLSGKTVEVISTDAEGRLLLADALSFAVRHGAELLVDIATLTGACAVALGRGGSGVFGNDDRARDLLLRAAAEVGERMWPLPLWDEYRDALRSEHADLKNTAGRWGAAINAALFLREFTAGRPWLHLDIAGPAWAEQGGVFGPAGATGHGVRTLLRFLELWAGRDEGPLA
ncbi:MAG: leucyl aminopeptidase [Thermomicrobium sp.]|nr:leucyl aminopeptidase [Thermomicrobium sp.]